MLSPNRILGFWLGLLALLATALSADKKPMSIAELAAYKDQLFALYQQQTDPDKAAELQQAYQLLEMMHRSMLIEQAKKDTPAASPEPTEVVESPLLPEPVPVKPPSNTEPEPVPVVSPIKEEPAPPTPAYIKQAPPPPAEVPEEIITPPELPDWFFEATLTKGIGYQQNLLRSAFSDLDSAALYGELSLQLLNTKRTQHRSAAFARYTRTHFWEEPDVRDEDLLFLLGQYEYRLSDTWWLGFRGTYLNAHQPIDDPEIVDLGEDSVPFQISQLNLAPMLTWNPTEEHEWTLTGGYRDDAIGSIANLEDQSSDQWWLEVGHQFTPSKAHRFRAQYRHAHRRYDERRERLPNGDILPGSHAEIQSHEIRGTYRYTWERADLRCRLTTGLGYLWENDSGGGYDDLERFEGRLRLDVKHRKVAFNAELRGGLYEYQERFISRDDNRNRERRYWTARLEATYELTEKTKLWLRYEYRDNAGNRNSDEYRYNVVYTGFHHTF